MESDENICKKLEEIELKGKVLDSEFPPKFDKYVDEIDCNQILIKFLITEKRKRVADQKAR